MGSRSKKLSSTQMTSSPRSSARRAQAATSRTSPRAASPIPTLRPSSATRSPYSRAVPVAIGIRPEATIIVSVGQQARADRIRQMFDQVAARYDARNRLFSADRDRAWRRRAAQRAALRPGQTALDLCTGTGKLAHELVSFVGPSGRVIGVDFSPAMLELARRREPQVEFRLGDVTRLDQPDASVDAVTIGFGLRNLVDRNAALREMRRVLRPGGRLVILEFAPPPGGMLMRAYHFYLSRVMPAVAGLLSAGEGSAYHYLAETVEAFPQPAQLAQQLERLGFTVTVERLTLGIAALHVGVRQR